MYTDSSKNAYTKWLLNNTQHLYDNAPFGYLVTLPRGLIFETNQVILDWLDYEEIELVHKKSFQDLLSMGGKIYYETHHRPLENLQGLTRELNYNLVRKDRKRLPVLVNTQVHTDETGKALFTRIFIYDITDRKKYEKELVLAKKKAEEAAQIKASFLSTVSHEIRTPMNAIMGTTDLLLKNPYLPTQFDLLNILNLSTKNLLALINNVLDLSKNDANKMILERKSIYLQQHIDALISGWQAKVKEKNLELIYHFDKNIPTYLIGDGIKIGQVINNLLGNAVKFTEQGQITLSVSLERLLPQRVELLFAVIDTGIGIHPDHQTHIFEAFNQANISTASEYGGTGLGLAISQNIIRLYHSQLKVESKIGKGSKFYFNLALEIGEIPIDQKTLATTTFLEKSPLQNISVLLVEDNESNIFIASSYFNRWKLHFDVAKNGQIAIDLVKKNNYDLILMDLRMPVLDGYEATATIRQLEGERYKKLPIIALSASTKENLEIQKKQYDFDDFLLKPFNPEQLYLMLQSYQKVSTSESQLSTSPNIEKASEIVSTAFNLLKMEELLDKDEAAIQDFVPTLIDDLEAAKVAIRASLSKPNLQEFRDITHKYNTVFNILDTRHLKTLLHQTKQILEEKTSGDLNVLNQSIEAAILVVIKALKQRRSDQSL